MTKCDDGCGMEVPALSGHGRVWSRFSHVQMIGEGEGVRMYDVMGDHPLAGSTVSVKTLLDKEIPITDMTEEAILEEYRMVVRFLREPS